MHCSFKFLPFVVTAVDAVQHRNYHDRLHKRNAIVVDGSGICPAPSVTTVLEVQAAYYHEPFPYNTAIEPFRNGIAFTVSNAPTDVTVTGYVTGTRVETHSPSPDISPSSTGPAVNTISVSGPGSLLNSEISSPTAAEAQSSSIRNAPRSSSTSQIPQALSASSLDPTQTTSQSVTVADLTSVEQTTPTPTLETLRIGLGLPSGTVSDLPSGSFLLLAFTSLPPAAARRDKRNANDANVMTQRPAKELERRQESTADPVFAADLANPTGSPDAPGRDNCDDSTPMILQRGSLLNSGSAIAKLPDESMPLLGFLVDDPVDEVNTTFALIDGFLSWITPSNEVADFFSCSGSLIAAFGDEVPDSCTPVIVGAINGTACSRVVAQT
ncbi:uncharacterized protein AB675_11734 [Cyphellophora attinorum]|uniref:DUF7908 domain-containing protein n=1 Tax=Cyphellophora attinorum TaxID=1664694 RepID=A0A0N0NI88_9EURO|nr:uncharacterized protein AB675_11734 [Phialophora attinorum]KPI35458.1 hypothetical protein AB675_11734 [Phialophora attinorum]